VGETGDQCWDGIISIQNKEETEEKLQMDFGVDIGTNVPRICVNK
jgi:hypothetical protein